MRLPRKSVMDAGTAAAARKRELAEVPGHQLTEDVAAAFGLPIRQIFAFYQNGTLALVAAGPTLQAIELRRRGSHG